MTVSDGKRTSRSKKKKRRETEKEGGGEGDKMKDLNLREHI